jgi:hypothetical protein
MRDNLKAETVGTGKAAAISLAIAANSPIASLKAVQKSITHPAI